MKILVVDDHVLIRDALREVLRELKGETVVFVEACASSEALEQLERHSDVELVLLDLNLPDRSGLETLRELGVRWPTVPVVVLSAFQDRDKVSKALELGAVGFIPKSARREVMCGALNLIFAGGIYVPPEIMGRGEPAGHPPESAPDLRSTAAALALTERQVEVLALMMQGRSNKAICRTLGLAESTVKIHVSAILRALNASNRTEAVVAVRALAPLPSRRAK